MKVIHASQNMLPAAAKLRSRVSQRRNGTKNRIEAATNALVKTRQRGCFLSPAIHAAGGAGFGNDDFCEQRQTRFQVSPNPDRDVFAGGIFEPGNFI